MRCSMRRATRRCSAFPASELDDLRSPLRFLLGHTQLEKELTGLTLASAPNGSFTLTGQPKRPGKTRDAADLDRHTRRRH